MCLVWILFCRIAHINAKLCARSVPDNKFRLRPRSIQHIWNQRLLRTRLIFRRRRCCCCRYWCVSQIACIELMIIMCVSWWLYECFHFCVFIYNSTRTFFSFLSLVRVAYYAIMFVKKLFGKWVSTESIWSDSDYIIILCTMFQFLKSLFSISLFRDLCTLWLLLIPIRGKMLYVFLKIQRFYGFLLIVVIAYLITFLFTRSFLTIFISPSIVCFLLHFYWR